MPCNSSVLSTRCKKCSRRVSLLIMQLYDKFRRCASMVTMASILQSSNHPFSHIQKLKHNVELFLLFHLFSANMRAKNRNNGIAVMVQKLKHTIILSYMHFYLLKIQLEVITSKIFHYPETN